MKEEILLLINKKIINIGNTYLNNKKFDLSKDVNITKFLKLKRYKEMLSDLDNCCSYNYNKESILEIIKTNIY